MSKLLFSKFCNYLKTNKITVILNYTNIYLKILFLLFQEGLIRGFYFEYLFNVKYIVILIKQVFYSCFTLNLNHNCKNNYSLRLLIFTTNCGIIINKKKHHLFNKCFYINVL